MRRALGVLLAAIVLLVVVGSAVFFVRAWQDAAIQYNRGYDDGQYDMQKYGKDMR